MNFGLNAITHAGTKSTAATAFKANITVKRSAASDWKRKSEKITHMITPAIKVAAVKPTAKPVVLLTSGIVELDVMYVLAMLVPAGTPVPVMLIPGNNPATLPACVNVKPVNVPAVDTTADPPSVVLSVNVVEPLVSII